MKLKTMNIDGLSSLSVSVTILKLIFLFLSGIILCNDERCVVRIPCTSQDMLFQDRPAIARDLPGAAHLCPVPLPVHLPPAILQGPKRESRVREARVQACVREGDAPGPQRESEIERGTDVTVYHPAGHQQRDDRGDFGRSPKARGTQESEAREGFCRQGGRVEAGDLQAGPRV